jgi:hypothetical protein
VVAVGRGEASGIPAAAAAGIETEPDWFDRICPYLLSEDGTYRSDEPDPDHRCMAQDPPGSLPIAFQERFCLTERHVRCEMYKVAQAARAAALGEVAPGEQARTGRFRPSVRSVPVALGPASDVQAGATRDSRRPIILAAVGIGIVAVTVFVLVLVLGGGGPGGGSGSSPSPSPIVTAAPPTAPPASQPPAAVASIDPEASPEASQGGLSGLRMAEYEVQEGEALLAIAERFGVTRRQILLANPGMAETKPYTETGQVIIVPVSPEVAEQLLAASPPPGFIGFVE